uniref:Kazal-like domain-containing protein n=1 Tax=Pseudictyota dubia TaxID=2749911 RepID=A0A7R9W559_9STRA|mmetsp:Transcript_34468/g.63698  ORF Transcript_34468/g.63698 Transcript_34468/m.63698 type:complete len:131 (+) Transcript_34468:120-512(+)
MFSRPSAIAIISLLQVMATFAGQPQLIYPLRASMAVASGAILVRHEATGATGIRGAMESIGGRRTSQCSCPMVYEPVCGDDGSEYKNSCFAQCEGVKYKPGMCCRDLGQHDCDLRCEWVNGKCRDKPGNN